MLIEATAGQSYITFVHKLTPRVFEEDIENEPTSRAGRNFDLSSLPGSRGCCWRLGVELVQVAHQ